MDIIAAEWISPSIAIVVAIIAGAFSFLGLVLSKEQKVSELRQAWIDGLREDLAAHISAVFAVSYLVEAYEYEHEKPSLVNLSKAIKEPHTTAAVTFHRILLRLNPDDKNIAHKELIAELKKNEGLFRCCGLCQRLPLCSDNSRKGTISPKSRMDTRKTGRTNISLVEIHRFSLACGSHWNGGIFRVPTAA